MIAAHIAVSILPVLGFLAVLMSMDSYRLIPFRSVLRTIIVGVLVAVVCYFINDSLYDRLQLGPTFYSRHVAPLLEETLKAVYIVILIRGHRIGFLVDAAIYGFAVGTGFAVVENVNYLQEFGEAKIVLWIVRGFGTAIMHGVTTALFAILSKGFADRRVNGSYVAFLLGLVVAVAIHTVFNYFVLPPLVTTGVLLTVLPLLFLLVFERSERATRSWLGIGFDSDVELLEQLKTGELRETRVGRYLESLKGAFPPIVVADLLCLLQVHLELSARAKGQILARQAGINLGIDDSVRANLKELRYLEASVGKTGKMALQSLINLRSRDLWQLYTLDGRG